MSLGAYPALGLGFEPGMMLARAYAVNSVDRTPGCVCLSLRGAPFPLRLFDDKTDAGFLKAVEPGDMISIEFGRIVKGSDGVVERIFYGNRPVWPDSPPIEG
jgi:hypothetical protein